MIYIMNGFIVKGEISMIKKTMCASVQQGTHGNTVKIYNDDIYEFIDPDTGVHYWIYSHKVPYGGMGGMTPRLNSDGTVMVTK